MEVTMKHSASFPSNMTNLEDIQYYFFLVYGKQQRCRGITDIVGGKIDLNLHTILNDLQDLYD